MYRSLKSYPNHDNLKNLRSTFHHNVTIFALLPSPLREPYFLSESRIIQITLMTRTKINIFQQYLTQF